MKKILPIILLNFVNVLGFSLLIPVLPNVVASLIDGAHVAMVYGMLLSSYALCQFLAAPLLGSLSDKYGRRPLLLISQTGTLASWFIFGSAYLIDPAATVGPIPLMLLVLGISRIADGITGGNISVANAWVSDVTPPEEKSKTFGLLGASFGVGFLIGPVLGGLAYDTQWGILAVFLLAAVISLVTLVVMYVKLPESLTPEARDEHLEIHFWRDINVFNKFELFMHDEHVMDLLKLRIIFSLVFAGFVTLIMIYLSDRFGLSATGLGVVMSIIGIFSIFNQSVSIQKIVAKWGDMTSFYVGLFLLCTTLLVIPLIPNTCFWVGQNAGVFMFLGIAFFMNMGLSVGATVFKAILTNAVDESKQGQATGVDESLLALGNGVAPVFAGFAYGIINANLFYILSLLLLVPTLYFYRKYH